MGFVEIANASIAELKCAKARLSSESRPEPRPQVANSAQLPQQDVQPAEHHLAGSGERLPGGTQTEAANLSTGETMLLIFAIGAATSIAALLSYQTLQQNNDAH